jgi:hypothetical protein
MWGLACLWVPQEVGRFVAVFSGLERAGPTCQCAFRHIFFSPAYYWAVMFTAQTRNLFPFIQQLGQVAILLLAHFFVQLQSQNSFTLNGCYRDDRTEITKYIYKLLVDGSVTCAERHNP